MPDKAVSSGQRVKVTSNMSRPLALRPRLNVPYVCYLPVSRGVPCSEATNAPMLGWLVIPDMESTATSTTSAPASAHASIEATPAPDVSCVCTWIGTEGCLSRIAVIRSLGKQ